MRVVMRKSSVEVQAWDGMMGRKDEERCKCGILMGMMELCLRL